MSTYCPDSDTGRHSWRIPIAAIVAGVKPVVLYCECCDALARADEFQEVRMTPT